MRGKGSSLQKVLDEAFTNPEKLCKCLAEHGRELYEAGRPYSHYSETINAVGSERPSARRLLTGAWDVAFSWLREEPFEHHIACPFQVLLALCAVCMCWGWIEVAGLLALSWGGICRIGEVLAAYRRDLILPSDVMHTSASVLLRVQEPKTRFLAARHPVAKVEYEDLVELIICAFEQLKPGERLWKASPQLLRSRFRHVCGGSHFPPDALGGCGTDTKARQMVECKNHGDLSPRKLGHVVFSSTITSCYEGENHASCPDFYKHAAKSEAV